MIKTILLFFVMLSIIIVIHEGGHFIAAKCFNIYCQEFSLGMGPKLFSKKGKETTFCIRAFPMGGFVAMAGDNENELETKVEVEVPKERTLKGIHPIKKIIIMSAGIIMNLLLAFIVMSLVYLSSGKAYVSPEPIIASVNENYPAYEADIRPGDKVLKVRFQNGYQNTPKDFDELSTFLSLYDGKGNITFTILRDNEKLQINVKPIFDENENRYLLGISSIQGTIVDVNFLNCWAFGFDYFIEITSMLIMTLVGLFRGVGLDSLSGPIAMVELTGDAISYGVSSYFSLIALISLNIGLFNLLPIPVFDGGRIFITIIEMISHKDLPKEVETKIMNISTILILILFAYVMLKDVFNLFF